MSSETLNANAAAMDGDRNLRGFLIFVSIMSVALGTAAIVYNGTATAGSVFVFGWLLLVAGVTQMVQAFQVRTSSGYWLWLLAGITRVTIGTMLVLYPTSSAEALTLVLSFYLMVGGLFKTFGSLELQFPSWLWSVASGLVSMALAVLLAAQWPASGMWFIGLAIGLDLIVYGWALLMFAAAVKNLTPSYLLRGKNL